MIRSWKRYTLGGAHLVHWREEGSQVNEYDEGKYCGFSQTYLLIRKVSNFAGVSFIKIYFQVFRV